jgi:hypothetical protein
MAQDATELFIGAQAQIYIGDVTETIPGSATGDPGGSFVDLGLVTNDGFTITDGKNTEQIRALQSFYPVRRVTTEKSFTAKFELEQYLNEDVLAFAYGGATFTGGVLSPPDPSVLAQYSLFLSLQDGANAIGIFIPVGMVTEDVESKFVRTAAALAPITFEATPASTSVDAWNLILEVGS